MAEDRAGEVDLEIYKFCTKCDSNTPQQETDDSIMKSKVNDSIENSKEECETNLPINPDFQHSYASRLTAGLIAPAVSRDAQLVIYGGLNGAIQVLDIKTKTTKFADSIGPGTIVAIAPFPVHDHLAVLTSDGHLLIADISNEKSIDQINQLNWMPSEVFVDAKGFRSVVSEMNGPFSLWNVRSGQLVYRDKLRSGCVFVRHHFSQDFLFSVITAHGDDFYDGWIIAAFDLVKGTKVFEFESHTKQDKFGDISLISFKSRKLVYVSKWPKILNESVDSLTGKPVWIDLHSGEITTNIPTHEANVLSWATPSLCAKNGTILNVTENGQSVLVTLPCGKNREKDSLLINQQGTTIKFSPDSKINVSAIAIDGSFVVIACESAIHFLKVEKSKGLK